MEREARQRIMVTALAVLALVGAVILITHLRPHHEPVDKDYYTGPFKAKGKNQWATDDGKIVPAPASATKAPVNASGSTE